MSPCRKFGSLCMFHPTLECFNDKSLSQASGNQCKSKVYIYRSMAWSFIFNIWHKYIEQLTAFEEKICFSLLFIKEASMRRTLALLENSCSFLELLLQCCVGQMLPRSNKAGSSAFIVATRADSSVYCLNSIYNSSWTSLVCESEWE